ncbi:MAG: FAD-dependent oxidoreductase [Planctomycetota bacterium]
MSDETKSCRCCVLGAGPAGLATALELVRHGITGVVVIDRNNVPGGLARTESFGGARFDIGPHRFFTKNAEVNNLWHEILGRDFRPVDRLTRIFYKKKLFNYPIKAADALIKLGLVQAIHALASFAVAKVKPHREAVTFEDWITQRFGRKLYETFFKTYTEKVWGIPCSQIGAEWAAQRIKGLDIVQVIRNAVFGAGKKQAKTLVEQFDYPRLGAGQMYEAIAQKCAEKGVEFMFAATALSFQQQDNKIMSVKVACNSGRTVYIKAEQFFSSVPLTQFFTMLQPCEADEVLESAKALYFRDHITVNLLVQGTGLFPDQWVYVHSPDVRVARVANYNNFSKEMAGREGRTPLSAEYFIFQHDDMWKKEDDYFKTLAITELRQIGLIKEEDVQQTWVVRETEAYPTYYLGFEAPYEKLKKRMDQFVNIMPIGRGGMYKYNNQDHSTYSGLLAARNYLKLADSPYNLWDINIDAEYHESAKRQQ